MNKDKIRELAKQACIPDNQIDNNLEKFVELVLKEYKETRFESYSLELLQTPNYGNSPK